MNFWETHSLWFVFFMCLFPRLTMLFATAFGGGFWYWVGWLLCPRLVVAIIATMLYADTNIVLVVFAWLWALGGESVEKTTVKSGT